VICLQFQIPVSEDVCERGANQKDLPWGLDWIDRTDGIDGIDGIDRFTGSPTSSTAPPSSPRRR
jgi:hypothetical protein